MKCPSEGCDYEGSKVQVQGHWGASKDESHTGPFPREGKATEGANEGLSFPKADKESACPDCGSHDYHDTDELLRSEDWGSDAKQILNEYDRVCAACGEAYND